MERKLLELHHLQAPMSRLASSGKVQPPVTLRGEELLHVPPINILRVPMKPPPWTTVTATAATEPQCDCPLAQFIIAPGQWLSRTFPSSVIDAPSGGGGSGQESVMGGPRRRDVIELFSEVPPTNTKRNETNLDTLGQRL